MFCSAQPVQKMEGIIVPIILKQVEAIPATYPTTPTGLSPAANELSSDAIWARIESYIAHRFTSRAVVWTIEGAGDWSPPLTPAAVTAAQKWVSGSWVEITLPAGPFGFCLPSDGVIRVSANVGGGTVPAAVSEAFRRLAEYSADTDDRAGASSYSASLGGGDVGEHYTRASSWLARAMQNSGAGDLLRQYRRAQ